MKKNALILLFVVNFALIVSAMEETETNKKSITFEKYLSTLPEEKSALLRERYISISKKNSDTVLGILNHELPIMSHKVRRLTYSMPQSYETIAKWQNHIYFITEIIRQLQEHTDSISSSLDSAGYVYTLFPLYYNLYFYHTYSYFNNNSVSQEVLNQMYTNLGKLAMINKYNEDYIQFCSSASLQEFLSDNLKNLSINE